jgi:uncharacterized protein (TIGR03492 family)
MRILFISNGYGEDNVAAHIARAYQERFPEHTVEGFPTVGSGRFYEQLGIALAGRGIDLPSEGFVRSPGDFFKDVLHGFFSKTIRLGFMIRKTSVGFGLLVVVGDPYLLLFLSVFSPLPREKKVFVGLQQSEWYGSKKPFKLHYSALERIWLKRFSGLVIVRDTKTRDFLIDKGVQAAFSAGNPMMDCFPIEEEAIFPAGRTVIGILPGSKREAYDNFGKILETVEGLQRRAGHEMSFLFVVAFPPNLDLEVLEKRYGLKRAKVARCARGFDVYRLEKGEIELHFSRTLFGNILSESTAVIGLSGTANEQAAGLGKPVFAFWGDGPQITRKFLIAQKKLLGHALFVFPPDTEEVACRMYEVLQDEALMQKARADGIRRMSGRGSIGLILRKIEAYLLYNSFVDKR